MAVTYYEILQISQNANIAVIQASYRALAKLYHPDVNKDASSTLLFQQLQEAYEVLSDPKKRSEYDASINSSSNAYDDNNVNIFENPIRLNHKSVFLCIEHFINDKDLQVLQFDIVTGESIGRFSLYKENDVLFRTELLLAAAQCEVGDIKFFESYTKTKKILNENVFVLKTSKEYKNVLIVINEEQDSYPSISRSHAYLRFLEIIHNLENSGDDVLLQFNFSQENNSDETFENDETINHPSDNGFQTTSSLSNDDIGSILMTLIYFLVAAGVVSFFMKSIYPLAIFLLIMALFAFVFLRKRPRTRYLFKQYIFSYTFLFFTFLTILFFSINFFPIIFK